jgi:hypothetical protein
MLSHAANIKVMLSYLLPLPRRNDLCWKILGRIGILEQALAQQVMIIGG